MNGKATSFAAKYFDFYDAEDDSFWATLTAKVGKEVVTNGIVVSGHAGCVTLPDGSDAGVTNGVIVADRFDAWQYSWKVEPWKSVGKTFDKRETSYEEDGVKVTLKFSAKGTAKVTGEFTDASGKVVKATGSATLLPTLGKGGETRYIAFVYLAPRGLPPHARCVEVAAEVAE